MNGTPGKKSDRQRAALRAWFMHYHPLRAFPRDVEMVVDAVPDHDLSRVVGNALRILKRKVKP